MRHTGLSLFCLSLIASATWAQPAPSSSATPTISAKSELPTVTIERAALTPRSPDQYRTPLYLKAQRTVRVAAQRSGVVDNVYKKLGDKVTAQEEFVQLNLKQAELQRDRANALLRAAQLEALSGAAKEIGEARVAAANADVELAELQLEACHVRAPFAGIVMELIVQPGNFVRAGDHVFTVADSSVLTALVPIERSQVKIGDTLTLQVEGRRANAKVEAILPPPAELEPLRDLFNSLAVASVVIENRSNEWSVGQTILSDLIPRHPIVEVANQAVLNGAEGERKVQVLREGFVRSLPVQLLGNVGDTHVFVSGRFQAGDELITSSSTPLSDGTWLRPRLEVEGPAKSDAATPGSPTPKPVTAPSF